MSEVYHTIYASKKPNPDVLIGLYVLKEYGEEKWPGVSNAKIELVEKIPGDKNGWLLEEDGILSMCFRDSSFPYSKKKSLARQIISKLPYDPGLVAHELARVAEERDEKAAGLFKLLSGIVKANEGRGEKIVRQTMPVIKSHARSLQEKAEKLHDEYVEKFNAGDVEALKIIHQEQELRVMIINSDNELMTTFLTDHEDINADLVSQHYSSGRITIFSDTDADIKYLHLVSMLRIQEAVHEEKNTDEIDLDDIATEGSMSKEDVWEFVPRKNVIQTKAKLNLTSQITKEELKGIITCGLSDSPEEAAPQFCNLENSAYKIYQSQLDKEKEAQRVIGEELTKRQEELRESIVVYSKNDVVYLN